MDTSSPADGVKEQTVEDGVVIVESGAIVVGGKSVLEVVAAGPGEVELDRRVVSRVVIPRFDIVVYSDGGALCATAVVRVSKPKAMALRGVYYWSNGIHICTPISEKTLTRSVAYVVIHLSRCTVIVETSNTSDDSIAPILYRKAKTDSQTKVDPMAVVAKAMRAKEILRRRLKHSSAGSFSPHQNLDAQNALRIDGSERKAGNVLHVDKIHELRSAAQEGHPCIFAVASRAFNSPHSKPYDCFSRLPPAISDASSSFIGLRGAASSSPAGAGSVPNS